MDRFLKRSAPSATSSTSPPTKRSKQGNICAAQRVREYGKDKFHASGGKLFCSACNVVVDHVRKFVVDQHLQSKVCYLNERINNWLNSAFVLLHSVGPVKPNLSWPWFTVYYFLALDIESRCMKLFSLVLNSWTSRCWVCHMTVNICTRGYPLVGIIAPN